MTIIIAVGLDADGELLNLYTGPSYVAAEGAMVAAGSEGRISRGWIYNNPVPTIQQFYNLKPQERRGRPKIAA